MAYDRPAPYLRHFHNFKVFEMGGRNAKGFRIETLKLWGFPPLFLPIIAYTLSTTKLEIRAK
jgi:hypothetical protein